MLGLKAFNIELSRGSKVTTQPDWRRLKLTNTAYPAREQIQPAHPTWSRNFRGARCVSGYVRSLTVPKLTTLCKTHATAADHHDSVHGHPKLEHAWLHD
jgi:hypothetical protein